MCRLVDDEYEEVTTNDIDTGETQDETSKYQKTSDFSFEKVKQARLKHQSPNRRGPKRKYEKDEFVCKNCNKPFARIAKLI
jgi:protein-arginine kinase activator protein McsA